MKAARYLLDTNICIYIAKQRPVTVMDRFCDLQVGDIGMSIITHGELCFGAEKCRNSQRAFEVLGRLIELIPVLLVPEQAALSYGAVRAALEKRGQPIGANDLWIAVHALSAGMTLVSNNCREFERVSGLKLENWV
ncbi:MAG: type II toxin-antitoxin system VapC family toxin [Thermoanaerobaculales bacterium]|nr:type II toxin-antitoxin system VapC family toxin [Thermoanaerobaculales bacterium]